MKGPDSSLLQRTLVGPQAWENLRKDLRKPVLPILSADTPTWTISKPLRVQHLSPPPSQRRPCLDFSSNVSFPESRRVLGLYCSLTLQKALNRKNQSISLIFLLSICLTSMPWCHRPRQAELSAAARPGAEAGDQHPSSLHTVSSG